MAPARLSLARVLAYASPGIAFSLFIAPFPAIMATFYATYTAATTAGIATILLATRLTDAFFDLGVGYWSDATRTRLGPRKPWLIAGMVAGVAAFAITFQPPPDAGLAYFTVAIVLYYLAIGMFGIPWVAWCGELATDYTERSRLAAYNTLALLVGGVAFLLLPNVLALPAIELVRTTEIDRPMMALYGWIGLCAFPPLVALAVLCLPHGAARPATGTTVRQMLVAARGNRPFAVLLAADVMTQLAWGVTYGVLFIALDKYFGLGAKVALILLAATFAQIVAIPACTAVAKRIGKHRTWGWASICGAAMSPVFLLFPPDGQASVPLITLVIGISSVFGTPNMMFPMAIVSDVADYDQLRSGENRNGSYYALRLLVVKACFAIGGSLALYLLAGFGFDPKTHANSEFARHGMLFTLVAVPNLMFLAAGFILLRFPIDARRHGIIRRRIDRRITAAAARTGRPASPGCA